MRRLGLVMALLALAALACGGGSDMMGCVDVRIDVCDGWESQGTVTNACSETLHGAEIYLTTKDSVGNILDRDAEYVEDLEPGEHAFVEWLLSTEDPEVAECEAEVTRSY